MNSESPAAGIRRWGIFFFLAAVGAFVAAVLLLILTKTPGADAGARPAPPGDLATLGEWEITSEGDFEERLVDTSGPRLRMRVATRRTRSDTVKFLGVRRREGIPLKEGTRITVDLDWNSQSNGSGLTAGLVLSPDRTSGNPFQLPDSLAIEYIGVPPGQNARLVIGGRQDGRHRHLTTEGWPDTNRGGRKIGLQRIRIEIGKDQAFRIFENEREVFSSGAEELPFESAYLYLQVSSRSNYPPREVYFGHVDVAPGK